MSPKYMVLILGFLALWAAFYVLYGLIEHDMDSAQTPHSVQTADDNGTLLAEVRVPRLSAAAEAGQAVFEANCAACHGINAAGKDGVGPPLVHIIYEPNHHGDQAFYQAVSLGVRAHHWRFGNMPPVDGVSQSQVRDIIAYVRELQRANDIF